MRVGEGNRKPNVTATCDEMPHFTEEVRVAFLLEFYLKKLPRENIGSCQSKAKENPNYSYYPLEDGLHEELSVDAALELNEFVSTDFHGRPGRGLRQLKQHVSFSLSSSSRVRLGLHRLVLIGHP